MRARLVLEPEGDESLDGASLVAEVVAVCVERAGQVSALSARAGSITPAGGAVAAQRLGREPVGLPVIVHIVRNTQEA